MVFSITVSQFSVSLFFSFPTIAPIRKSILLDPRPQLVFSVGVWENSDQPQASLYMAPITITCVVIFDKFAQ